MDRGDKLYFVEDITGVTYTKVSENDYKDWENASTLEQIDKCEKKIEQLKAQLI